MKFIVGLGLLACVYNSVSTFQTGNIEAGIAWLVAFCFALGSLSQYVS